MNTNFDEEYYFQAFQDILSAASEHKKIDDQIDEGKIILSAFRRAVQSWLDYHLTAYMSYNELLDRFQGFSFDDFEVLEYENDQAPEIPSFPKLLKWTRS